VNSQLLNIEPEKEQKKLEMNRLVRHSFKFGQKKKINKEKAELIIKY